MPDTEKEPELGHIDMEIAAGVMRLLEEQRRRLEMAIKIADDFKASDARPSLPASSEIQEQRRAEAQMSEEEVRTAVEKEEAEMAELEKQVDDMKKELGEVRSQIAAKKGEPSLPVSRAEDLKDVPANPAAEKWLEENMSGIHKSIAEQREKLKAILAEAEECGKNVSQIAQLRTRRLNCKNKMPFLKLALPEIEKSLQRAKEDLAKL